MTPPLVLASRSPRRAELLQRLGLRFACEPADIDERYEGDEMPAAHAERLAREKAFVAAGRHPDALVLAGDTVVVLGRDVLGKPRDAADAVAMLERLGGRAHDVYTAVAVRWRGRTESAVERTRVWMRALPRADLEAYVATGEPLDKAGAYGIQGYGAALVERIEGDFFAVMGLPVVRTLVLLERLGWRYRFDAGLEPVDAP